jgi:hypothetical protein
LLLTDARADFVRWYRATGTKPLPIVTFDQELSGLITHARLPVMRADNAT